MMEFRGTRYYYSHAVGCFTSYFATWPDEFTIAEADIPPTSLPHGFALEMSDAGYDAVLASASFPRTWHVKRRPPAHSPREVFAGFHPRPDNPIRVQPMEHINMRLINDALKKEAEATFDIKPPVSLFVAASDTKEKPVVDDGFSEFDMTPFRDRGWEVQVTYGLRFNIKDTVYEKYVRGYQFTRTKW